MREKADFWLKNVNNVTLNQKDYEDAVKATLELMFPTIKDKVPSITAIKSAMSWLVTRGAFDPYAPGAGRGDQR